MKNHWPSSSSSLSASGREDAHTSADPGIRLGNSEKEGGEGESGEDEGGDGSNGGDGCGGEGGEGGDGDDGGDLGGGGDGDSGLGGCGDGGGSKDTGECCCKNGIMDTIPRSNVARRRTAAIFLFFEGKARSFVQLVRDKAG